jgi:hypothetical protein
LCLIVPIENPGNIYLWWCTVVGTSASAATTSAEADENGQHKNETRYLSHKLAPLE